MFVHVSENKYTVLMLLLLLFSAILKSDLCSETSRRRRRCYCCSLFIVWYLCMYIGWNLLTLSQTLSLFFSFSSGNGHFSSLIRVNQFWDYNKWPNEMKNIIISTEKPLLLKWRHSVQTFRSQFCTRWIDILVSKFSPLKIALSMCFWHGRRRKKN